MRVEEQDVLAVTDPGIDASMTALFDVSAKLREEALLGTLLTSFVIVLLGLGMISFNRDVKKLVIVPIVREDRDLAHTPNVLPDRRFFDRRGCFCLCARSA